MLWIQDHAKEVIAIIVPFSVWLLNYYIKSSAKIYFSTPHQFLHLVEEPLKDNNGNIVQPKQVIHSQSIYVENVGREAAKNLELIFNWKPMHFNIWPQRNFEDKILPDGRYILIFASLAPKEFIGFELLSVNQDLPSLANIRCEQCVGKFKEMHPQVVYGRYFNYFCVLLFIVGFGTVIYWSIWLIQFLVLKT